MIRERYDCRMCHGDLREVLELTPTPIANSFPKEPNSGEFFPLELVECLDCQHVQLKHIVPSETLFGDYKYRTPEAFRGHLRRLAKTLRRKYPNAYSLLEIGSNNGLFLDEADKEDFTPFGVDPSYKGTILQGYFTEKEAERLGKKFDIVVALNTFAHINDLDDVFRGIHICLKNEGTVVFEVQYFIDLVEKGMFDMIYHEHLDYHTLKPLERFLARYGLIINEFEYIDTHGGSIRIYASRTGRSRIIPDMGVDWVDFQHKIEKIKNKVVFAVRQVKLQHKDKIALFGAAAKACTSIHHFGVKDSISYCVDNTPEKQGRYIPGTAIEIMPEVMFEIEPPDLVILTAWNYEDVFKAKFPTLKYLNPFG
jgi:SAM-dependent methyltransferase